MLKYTTYKSIHETNTTQDQTGLSPADTSSHTLNGAVQGSASKSASTGKTRTASTKEPSVTEWMYVEHTKSDVGSKKPLMKRAGRSLSRKTLDLIQMTARKTIGKKSARPSKKRKSGWNSTGRMMVCLLFAGVLLYGGVQHLVIAEQSPAMQQHVIVNEGDSLWAIASQYKAPGTDIRDYIAQIRDENHLNTSDIQSGDVLIIPHD